MRATGRRITKGQPVTDVKRQLARKFRRTPTPTERRVWFLLRGRRILGLKFRRQQIVAGFITDFYCAEFGLAIELDGAVHNRPGQREYDQERDRVLSRLGVRVIRLANDEATEVLLEARLRACVIVPPLP